MASSSSPPLTALVLAGGRSTRFGSDKASAALQGRPLLQWVVEAVAPSCSPVLVIAARDQSLPRLPQALAVTVVQDRWEARGPLAALATAMAAVRTEWCFAASCDMPLLSPALPALLLALPGEADDVVLPVVDGHPQPLAALYRVSRCLPHFERRVEGGQGKLLGALEGLAVRKVGEHELAAAGITARSFTSANDPGVLAALAAAEA